MPGKDYYQMCRDGIGRAVEIQDHDGKRHRGVIERVDRRGVYLKPLSQAGPEEDDRYGNSYLWGAPFFAPFFFPFASIYALTFLPFFWW